MPADRPLIGITTYPPNASADAYELPQAYVASVRRAGADAVLLPPGAADATALLDRIDGVVLAGGGDIDPSVYAGDAHETIYATHAARDADEVALVGALVERGMPTLAICRGSQVLAVALGGTLVTHLPDTLAGNPDAVLHRIEPPELRAVASPTPHVVHVEPDSHLARLMGATEVTPMSWHHQAVDRLGTGLRAVARAPDGTVEATEHESHPWLVSVQWHPELTTATDPTQQALFDGLVEACRSRVVAGAQEGSP